jgi:hypothetical protein
MSKSIESQVLISASPEKVWAALVDFGSYPKWNPFVQSISGEMRLGGRLVVRIVPPGERGMIFKPTITELHEGSVLEWLGHLVVPGVFDGRHRFQLGRLPDGTTSLSQSETFSGLIVPLFASSLESTRRGFEASNAALKSLCEGI